MSFSSELEAWFSQEKKRIRKEYEKLLSFPSISSDPTQKKGIEDCAKWLYNYLKNLSFKAEILPTPVHPIVFGEYQAAKNLPTLLIYNHYDVQPVDPREAWTTPPFTPTFQGKKVVARGASDNKGQLFFTLVALQAYLSIQKKLPFNVKYLIEGEEESASKGLSLVLEKLRKKLACDYILVPDFDIPSLDQPSITVAMRGIMTMEMEIIGSNRDLHSGHHGGIAYNPNRALVEILAKVFTKQGTIAIPGFYEGIIPWTEKEKKEINTSVSLEAELKSLQLKPLPKKGIESKWFHPTFEINGLSGGYSGEGFKTVIPARAKAKISCRLVPNQDPKLIYEKVKKFIQKHLPPQLKARFKDMGGGFAVKSQIHSSLIKALQSSYEKVFTKKASLICSGGSVPIIGEMIRVTGAQAGFMGVALDSDNVHAPNENFDMDRFKKGFLIVGNMVDSFVQFTKKS